MACSHTKRVSRIVEYEHPITGEVWEELIETNEWTYEDKFGEQRFRCTQCNEMFYYSKAARLFYEQGIPNQSAGLK